VIFLDTSFLYPLFNVEDDDHGRVREVFEARRGQPLTELLLTTPHVIFETITLIRLGQRQGRPDSATRHRQAVYAGSGCSRESWLGSTAPPRRMSARPSTTSRNTRIRSTASSTA
jgi:hypothetical protein